MVRERTASIWILIVLAVIAGILALLDAARYMGWLPVSITTLLGEIKFVLPSANWFGALLSALVGVIWFVVAGWLYNLNPSGWMFMVVMAIFNLILLVLAILGQTTFTAVLVQVLVNALVLILAFLPGTRAAFGQR